MGVRYVREYQGHGLYRHGSPVERVKTADIDESVALSLDEIRVVGRRRDRRDGQVYPCPGPVYCAERVPAHVGVFQAETVLEDEDAAGQPRGRKAPLRIVVAVVDYRAYQP